MPYLFLLFAVLLTAVIGFGGETSLLAYLQNELVVRHGWMTMEEFTELTAAAQFVPGSPAANMVTYTGYALAMPSHGFWVALGCGLLATLLLAFPSLWLMPRLMRLAQEKKTQPVASTVLNVLRPLACGLTASVLLLMLTPGNFGSPSLTPWQFGVSLFLFCATAVGVARYHFHPVFMLCLSAATGALLL